MEQKNLIKSSYDLFEAVKWWEKKRLIYNLTALAGGLLVVLLRSMVMEGDISVDTFLNLAVWLFGANIFYTGGWAIEVLLHYYFKVRFWPVGVRWGAFVLGSLFSVAWMFMLIREFG